MNLLRKTVKDFVEPVLSSTIGKVLWSPVSVAVLAHGEHDDILVLETDGGYELPGGCVKAGEDFKQACRREVMEETGCKVSVGRLLEIRGGDNGTSGNNFYFEAKVEEADLNGSWEGNPKFVKKEEVRELDWKLHHSHVHEYLFPEN